MGNTELLTKAVALVRDSPLLTPGQKSLYVSRIWTVSDEMLVQVIGFLEHQHGLLKRRLEDVPVSGVVKAIRSVVIKNREEENGSS